MIQKEFKMYIHGAFLDRHLTAREREILGLMAAGMTNPQIAGQLMIATGTVKTHTLNIYRKLEVANRTQAVVCAHQLGLLRAGEIPRYARSIDGRLDDTVFFYRFFEGSTERGIKI
jgi:DNA-binding CsgD family transcriptional regulator